MKINFVFRISDTGRKKKKVPGLTNLCCLDNFIQTFGIENLTIIADNCGDKLVSEIMKRTSNVLVTNLGNSKSFLYAVEFTLKNCPLDEYIYFVEDDYIHRENSLQVLCEGLSVSDYVTLYDHPDKYRSLAIPLNPLIKKHSEITEIIITPSTYWKKTNSTTLTFATKIKILKEDYSIWKNISTYKIPYDFLAFSILTKVSVLELVKKLMIKTAIKRFILGILYPQKRILINSIPGYSTHAEVDYLSPFINWNKEFLKATEKVMFIE